MNEVAIVIPIYKADMDLHELISYRQVRKIFSGYDMFFLKPESLEIGFEHNGIREIMMPDEYFKSVSAYNRLMLTKETYDNFIDYRYILIHQLDGYVFEDRLQYFCGLDYDYIGAPWLYGVFEYISSNKNIWYVGNGGVSLRRVRSTIKLLQEKKNDYKGNEDIYFAISDSDSFRVAPMNVALEFSFDEEVKTAFANNNHQMPMCAHAWYKYNFDFYRSYIEAEGYMLDNLSIEGNLDEINVLERKRDRDIAEFFKNRYSTEVLCNSLKMIFDNYSGEVVVWGNGRNGAMLRRMLQDAEQKILCIIDSNTWMNFSEFKKIYSDRSVPIIVSPYNAYDEIASQLKADGYCNYLGFKQLIDKMTYSYKN